MRDWLLRLLIILCCIAICVNFVRVLVVTPRQPEPLDFMSVVQVISSFDVDVSPLYRDGVASLKILNDNFGTFLSVGAGLSFSNGISGFFKSIFNLLLAPVKLLMALVKSVIDFIVIAYQIFYRLYQMLNILFDGALGGFVT